MGRKVDWLRGVIVPVITPFEKNEEVDYESLRSVVDFLIEKKVNCLFPLGGTSEFHRLTQEEKKKVVDIAVDQANGKIPVMPGCHSLGTKLSIELARHAEDAGANAICLLQPYGLDAISEGSLFEHFKDVSQAVDLPMMLYTEEMVNEPSLELVNKLANLDNIMGIKLSTLDLYKFQRGVRLFGDRIAVCTGMESVYLFGLMVGGAGGTLGTANMIPEYWVKMYDLFSKGLLEEALEMHNRSTMKIEEVTGKHGFREVIKEALTLRGIPAGRTRRPGKPLPASARDEIAEMLKNVGIETPQYPQATAVH
jgi:dihydrodipicolinate synthase/N-acetylneuraminate lyase